MTTVGVFSLTYTAKSRIVGAKGENHMLRSTKRDKFSGHDKRVTLNLALHSVVARERRDLVESLQAASAFGWDLDQLTQEQNEIIYANFDEEFEKLVLSEFEADPSFLVDLHGDATCPLCGHVGIRWLFRVMNTKGGESINCGSECIITWGISVRGAETAEAAKAALEAQIRKAIKALLIKAWHERTGFKTDWFTQIRESLRRISASCTMAEATYTVYYAHRVQSVFLKRLEAFYSKNGWLNTETKWKQLAGLVEYCIKSDEECHLTVLPSYEATKPVKAVVEPKSVEVVSEVKEVVVEVRETVIATSSTEAQAQASELAWVREQAPVKKPGQLSLALTVKN
jgi:hypothetical protein